MKGKITDITSSLQENSIHRSLVQAQKDTGFQSSSMELLLLSFVQSREDNRHRPA